MSGPNVGTVQVRDTGTGQGAKAARTRGVGSATDWLAGWRLDWQASSTVTYLLSDRLDFLQECVVNNHLRHASFEDVWYLLLLLLVHRDASTTTLWDDQLHTCRERASER